MEKIIADYRKTFTPTLIKYWAMAVLFALGLSLAVLANRKLLIPAIVISAYFIIMSVVGTLEVAVNEPARFKKTLGGFPENERNKISAEYGKAAKFYRKWFLEEYLLFYLKRRIMLIRYDEIESAESKGFKIWLKMTEGRMTALPLLPNENPAVIIAALRVKNPNISVLINGKVVESMEKRKME